ncbi:hypothetical protein [Pseudomonas sp. NPDC096925]|uniref:hypothetical protein n=1 Tax=Pseudomonas sp. NPDC096925 TaxID=3364484 RepID=UPI00383A5D6D
MKLEEHCREREFNEEAFRAALLTGVCSQICESTHDDDEHAALPEWMSYDGGLGANAHIKYAAYVGGVRDCDASGCVALALAAISSVVVN